MASRCEICEDVLSKVYGEEWVETAGAKKTTEPRDDPLQPHKRRPRPRSRCEDLGHHAMEKRRALGTEWNRMKHVTVHHSRKRKHGKHDAKRDAKHWQCENLDFSQKASDVSDPPTLSNGCPATSCA